jgi:hypothetical protein
VGTIEQGGLIMDLQRVVSDELSGFVAKLHVAQISGFHRIQGSTMFHEAAEYVKAELLKLGLADAVIEQFPADGASKYWTYVSPVGWTVRSAELRLVEPRDELICSFGDLPQCLHTFSNATPPEGVTGELVDVGTGTKPADYEGKDVKGKLVLATGRARPVHELAVYKYGALGVLTDTITYEMPGVRESLDIPDAHAYQAIWPTAEDLTKVTFGFSLSKRQGNTLRGLLANGKTVKLKAKVDAELFPFYEDVVTATIQGRMKSEEEVLLVAHLCHPKPSANDNASGAGLLLEVARTMKALVAKGRIEPPARTIRFLWVPETLGTVAYLQKHEDEVRARMVAGVNLDMVGQNQELCRSTLNMDRTPDSLPSYLNDFVYSLVEQMIRGFSKETVFGLASTYRVATTAFSGGSDHAEFTEATIGVPCVMLLQWPDLFYHTSEDTMDKVSEDSLKRVGYITATAALTLANADAETAYKLALETATRAHARIAEATRKATDELYAKTDKPDELAKAARYHRDRLEHIVWREQQATRSVRRLGTSAELAALLDRLCRDLEASGKQQTSLLEETLNHITKTQNIALLQIEETQADKEAKTLVPRRLFKGTLSSDHFKKLLGEEAYKWYTEIDKQDPAFNKKMPEILNFTDGQRNAHAITKAVSVEYTPTNAEHVLKFLKDLEKTKLITFQ